MDELLAYLLSNISDEYDKTEGYLVHDLLRAVAILLTEQNVKIQNVEKLINVDNLTGELLEAFVSQRKGIRRNQATFAKGLVSISGNGVVHQGDIFETMNGVQFEALTEVQVVGITTVSVQCLIAGAIGNVPANQIVQIPVTIPGITSVVNTLKTEGGYEAESDDSLRERYYIATRTPPTSGNVYHYLQWAKEVSGVGDAKVFPVERGDNTVDVVIIDQDKQPAGMELVQRVQAHIDPNSEGIGAGQAPIGAKCYVISALSLPVNITVTIDKEVGYDDAVVLGHVRKSIEGYLKGIAFSSSYVSYAKLGDAIINSEGVEDYLNMRVNGGTENIPIGSKHVATLGGVTFE